MQRPLVAILAAGVAGYSQLMGVDEAGTLAALKKLRGDVIVVKIKEHEGGVVKLTGAGMLVEFPSVGEAVACAATIQRGMRERNVDVPKDRRIEFRIGVNLADVIVEGDDICEDMGEEKLKNIEKPVRVYSERMHWGEAGPEF
jgi:adenylate cyclase